MRLTQTPGLLVRASVPSERTHNQEQKMRLLRSPVRRQLKKIMALFLANSTKKKRKMSHKTPQILVQPPQKQPKNLVVFQHFPTATFFYSDTFHFRTSYACKKIVTQSYPVLSYVAKNPPSFLFKGAYINFISSPLLVPRKEFNNLMYGKILQ